MAINGNNILVYKGGIAIAGTKSNEIQSGVDVIEISSANDGAWKKFIAGRKEWSVTTNFLILNYVPGQAITTTNGINDLLYVGQTYTLKFQKRNGTSGVTGTAILKTCKVTATRGNLCAGSFQFQGTGQLRSL